MGTALRQTTHSGQTNLPCLAKPWAEAFHGFLRANATLLALMVVLISPNTARTEDSPPLRFEGKYYRGSGDIDYLQLLERARRMFEPDPELQNLTMLYEPKWNGLVEGPTWDAWWIQNSYGTTYCILPFLREPYLTFLQNSQDLWFNQMGDGRRVGAPPPFNWVAPDGCLCDAARPGWIVYKQGDGRTAIHDWGMEFTAAGIVLQSELLLISRDPKAIAHYLPLLERSANFIATRRDPKNNLFLAGPAGNLLAPSYAGWHRPDGSYGQAYLAGLSITYIAALDRLIELEHLAQRTEPALAYTFQRELARKGLSLLTTDQGYFIRSLDPDGVKHGVFGATQHGYFETSPNHDAVAFRVVDDPQAQRIYSSIAAIPQLRPYDFILPNYPSYDDMYEKPEGLWAYGTWVNGGHWSTCEARMILAYYRLARFEDARQSMKRLLGFAARFRMDNPLTKCGSDVYQPNQPINLCYDAFGPPAAMLRGLFEYLYRADGLTLIPHIPPSVTELQQLDPVRFGPKRLWLSSAGVGPITAVTVNGRAWPFFDSQSVIFPYGETPRESQVQIILGHAKPSFRARAVQAPRGLAVVIPKGQGNVHYAKLAKQAATLQNFERRLTAAGLADSYEASHARLALEALGMINVRRALQQRGILKSLPEPAQSAADESYVTAATRLCDGLDALMKTYETASQGEQRQKAEIWQESQLSQ